MPWIDAPHEDDWGPDLDELRPRVTDPRSGRVDWIMRVHGLDAGSLEAHHVLYRQAMRGTTTLRKVEREMIALVVSQINECHYCVAHHRRGLRRLLRDDDLAAAIEADFETAGVSEKRKAMLRYSVKLTREPGAMSEEDVARIRAAGFTDLDMLHIAEVVGYMAYSNRIADGLGVPLEDWIPE